MSLALVRARALEGLAAPEVTVEVHLANGLPAFSLVGLPDTEVREARDRVRAAIQSSQFEFPQRRITVNLAPADLPKEGGRFDLAIAVGILVASGQVAMERIQTLEFCGELSLTGDLRPVRGVLAAALAAARAGRGLSCPRAMAPRRRLPGARACCRPQACSPCVRTSTATPRLIRWANAAPRRRHRSVCPILQMFAASSRRGGRWRWPPAVRIRCCCSVRPAPASRCLRSACLACCRR